MEPLILIALVLLAGGAAWLWQRRRKQRDRAAFTASTCGERAHPGGTLDPAAWFIGPVLPDVPGWGNKSPGMPPHPAPHAEGWCIDFPLGVDLPLGQGPKVDYITFRHGALAGKRQIRMRYRLEKEPGAEVLAVPEQVPTLRFPAQLTMHFQRAGDDWSGAGRFEGYRWYHTGQGPNYLDADGLGAEHELIVPLDSGWSAIRGSTSENNPGGFLAALEQACCVGFVFGGNENGYGHGARATGPARLIVTEFAVE